MFYYSKGLGGGNPPAGYILYLTYDCVDGDESSHTVSLPLTDPLRNRNNKRRRRVRRVKRSPKGESRAHKRIEVERQGSDYWVGTMPPPTTTLVPTNSLCDIPGNGGGFNYGG